jgi:succinate-semialdehyde dehydrogenase/glutarate-semialdehyde dehydrogenase
MPLREKKKRLKSEDMRKVLRNRRITTVETHWCERIGWRQRSFATGIEMIDLNDETLFRQTSLIDGVWRNAADGATVAVTNPATGAVLGTVPDCGEAETRAAINAAEASLPAWKARTHAERAKLLEQWHALIASNAEDLARILTLEQGKPLAEARGEISYGNAFVKWFAEEARRIGGTTIPSPTQDRRILVTKEAVGVCAIITPWNFPNAMITRKVAPALAAGCTVVIKPSEFTPFSAIALVALAERAGIPAGVINVVTGMPAAIGAEITSNTIVRKLSFTGSTRVGSILMRNCADSIKRLSLELGGNAPFIVFDDADLDQAIEGVLVSKFRNGGQTCVCANRILVQSGVYEAFADKLAARVTSLKIGDGTAEGTMIGPMINEAAVDKINRHIADAVAKGATAIISDNPRPSGSQYVSPVVLRDATTEMLLAQEETFGPVAPLFRFETEAEAIAIANGTPFGLAAYFYTRDLARSFRVGEALEFGMVGLNTGLISTEVAPFGGVKQSGLGREGSQLGIEEYLEVKALHIGGL